MQLSLSRRSLQQDKEAYQNQVHYNAFPSTQAYIENEDFQTLCKNHNS